MMIDLLHHWRMEDRESGRGELPNTILYTLGWKIIPSTCSIIYSTLYSFIHSTNCDGIMLPIRCWINQMEERE